MHVLSLKLDACMEEREGETLIFHARARPSSAKRAIGGPLVSQTCRPLDPQESHSDQGERRVWFDTSGTVEGGGSHHCAWIKLQDSRNWWSTISKVSFEIQFFSLLNRLL